jgi:UDP-N-acetylmuramoylalanine--D-glutamate ligase
VTAPSAKPRPPLPGGPYLVVGLARSGQAAALALRALGEEVIGVDGRAPETGRLARAGVEVHVDAPGTELLSRVAALVKSPGVPGDAAVIAAARERGLPVLGELEVAWRLLPNEFVAVTGTNGKTTTAELLGAIHREAGLPVAVAGNVGTAAASLVDEVDPAATIVCEASSFQLEDTEAFAPEAAVLTNLGSDHLDRHGTVEAYAAAKLRAFANQGNDDVAVIPSDLEVDDVGGCARRVCFGVHPGDDVSERAGQLWWGDEALIAVDEIRMPGAHNRQNAMAAAAAALARGIDPDAVRAALRAFPGVPHRLEEVGTRDGVLYVNDSKATNVASTLVALAALPPGGIHLILGGRGKGESFADLLAAIDATCRAVYAIGEAAPDIVSDLNAAHVEIHDCGDLERAVREARAKARPGDVVLLSPAAASFDQYEDFEARGEHFRALVES